MSRAKDYLQKVKADEDARAACEKQIFEELGASDFICVNARGDRLTQRGVRKMLQMHAECYGIPPDHAHPHSFRHLFAIEFLKRNPNIALLSDLLGHSSVQTTSIYLRLSHEQQQEAVNQAVTW